MVVGHTLSISSNLTLNKTTGQRHEHLIVLTELPRPLNIMSYHVQRNYRLIFRLFHYFNSFEKKQT